MTGKELGAQIISVVLGIILFLGPIRGGTSFDYIMYDIAVRSPGPYTSSEQSELDFLSCMEESLFVIPDGTSFEIASEDEYLRQRTLEIAYPRLRVTKETAEVLVLVNSKDPIGDKDLIQQVDCYGVDVRVVRNG
jgi:hypothetical protein